MVRAVVLLALVGCGAVPEHEQVRRSLDATVADDVGDARGRDCGDATTDYDAWIKTSSPSRDCFVRAFRACEPAHAAASVQGMDGGPHLWSAAVVAGDGGCEIRLYKDSRLDQYSSPEIERYRCAGEPGACTLVWTEDHDLCRDIGGTNYFCARLPFALRWQDVAGRRDTDEDHARTSRREAIEYDVADLTLAAVTKQCGSVRGSAREVLGGASKPARCFADAFTACAPAEVSGREEPGLSSTVGSEAWNSRDLKSRPH